MSKCVSYHSVWSRPPLPLTLLTIVLVLFLLILVKTLAPKGNLPLGEATTTSRPIPLFTDSSALACLPTNTIREQGKVVKVVDGDTVEVEINGSLFNVRYIGIDTPESTIRIEYFGEEAAARNQALVDGREVTLIKDVSETDRYGRLLRYVLVGEIFINFELVRGGYANALRYPPDVACAEVFHMAEYKAREEGLGLWAPRP